MIAATGYGHSEPYWAAKFASGERPFSTANVSSSVNWMWYAAASASFDDGVLRC